MKITALMTLLVPVLGSAAMAAGSFSVQDENNDGSISRDEWYGSVEDAGVFKDWDKNTDGFIDVNEYTLYDYDHEFSEWDQNDDDKLDDNEFNDGWFSAFDDDESGHWDGDEWDDAGDEGFFDL